MNTKPSTLMLILLLGYFGGLIFGIFYFFSGLNEISYLFINEHYGVVESRVINNFQFNNNLIGIIYCIMFFVAGIAFISTFFGEHINKTINHVQTTLDQNRRDQQMNRQEENNNSSQEAKSVENVGSVWSTEKAQMTN